MADLEFWGAPPEIIAELQGAEVQRAEDFEVLPEFWEAVCVFNRAQTQWMYAASGQITGLNYPGLSVVMQMMGITNTADVFEAVQIMENAVLIEFASRG